jgi:rhodanese-related sulfurtransferase
MKPTPSTSKRKTTSSHRATKDELYGQVARVAKAMASPKRLELLAVLAQAPRSVEDLARDAAISLNLASAHLKDLRLARLVETERDGKRVVYRLASPGVARACVALRELAEDRLVELQAIIGELGDAGGEWRTEGRAALLRKVRAGEVILLDVRPAAEYEHGHLPHARSLPHTELEARLAELPRDRPIVAYCRGPFCLFAGDAVRLMKSKGLDAMQLREGVMEWKTAG